MINSFFTRLLEEISKSRIDYLTNLRTNDLNTCEIPIPQGPALRIEIDKQEKNIILASKLGMLQPSRYRTEIFREALKANGAPFSQNGSFAFSKKTNELILHRYLDIRNLSSERIVQAIQTFIAEAKVWHEAINSANIPQMSRSAVQAPTPATLFGLT